MNFWANTRNQSKMESIRSLEDISSDVLYEAFQEAFKDYEMQLSRPELLKMLHRRGFKPHLSFGAFENGRLVSFTFNGIGTFMGISTAYDTGTGTIEEFRGKGLARRIFDYSIPHLKKSGIKQYLLEVLQHNTGAVSLYKRLGFEVSREFNYFSADMNMLHPIPESQENNYQIRSAGLKDKEHMRTFWDHRPSWQNSFEAVERRAKDFQIIGAYQNEKLLGYIIFEPGSGDITQLAVKKDRRRKGIASLLLREALEKNTHPSIKAVNYEISDMGISGLMESLGITWKGKQFEMIKKLTLNES